MDLLPLFEEQEKFKDRINYNEPDKFNKLILALLVEVGECANEWRGFKYWSQDQQPRTNVPIYEDYKGLNKVVTRKNLLLEEYVDGLAFSLEIGLAIGIDKFNFHTLLKFGNVESQFLELFALITELLHQPNNNNWVILIQYYLGLGEMLGFTFEQIELAYYSKMNVNHLRQDNGY